MTKKPLIVGIDPGSTSAVAAFDLDGELALLESRKEFSRDEIIKKIMENGLPVVVASDREEMPSTVEKIARSVGAEKFEPENDLSKERKKQLGEGDNSHELDAYASSLHAYNSLQRSIQKIESYADESGEYLGDVARRYFSESTLERKEEDKIRKTGSGDSSTDDSSNRLKSKLGEVRKENRRLKKEIERTKQNKLNKDIESEEIRRLERIISEKNEDIRYYKNKIRELEEQKSTFKDGLSKIIEGYTVVPRVGKYTEEVPDNVIVDSEELRDRLQSQGYNARMAEDLEGVMLEGFMVVEEFPEPESIRDMIEKD